MMSDAAARSVLLEAFALRGITGATLAEAQAVQAIGRFEGNYGQAFGGANNWGAIQCGHGPPCGEQCVETGDTHADGTKYRWCYRRYASPQLGAADLVKQLYRREGVPEALRAGDATTIASAMRKTGYFEAPVERYAQAIENNAHAIATTLGELWTVRRGGVPGLGAPPPPPPAPIPLPAPGFEPQSSGEAAGGTLALVAALFAAAMLSNRRAA